MKKVVLMYDEATGNIQDMEGVIILHSWLGLRYEEVPETSRDNVNDPLHKLKELKAMGMSVEDIKDLKEIGLL